MKSSKKMKKIYICFFFYHQFNHENHHFNHNDHIADKYILQYAT